MKKSIRTIRTQRQYAWVKVFKQLLHDPIAVVCLLVLAVFVFVMIFADWIVPYDYGIKLNGEARLLKPCAEHIFGCDSMGRDMFSRMVHGTRTSLSMGIGTTLVVVVSGTILGAVSAFYGGIIDMLIMRICDLFLCIPGILMALALVAALGPGRNNLLIAIAVSSIPGVTRQFRALMLNVMSNDYITAARASGARDWYIICKHVIPNVICNGIFNHTSLCQFYQGRLLLQVTIPFEEKPTSNLPGDNLRYYRQRKSLTTRQLAEQIDVVPATILMYEQNKHPIPFDVANSLADALDVNADLLYDDFAVFLVTPYSEALKDIRMSIGMSQRAFAEHIGVIPSYYYKLESGHRRPSRKVYQRMVDTLSHTHPHHSLFAQHKLQSK